MKYTFILLLLVSFHSLLLAGGPDIEVSDAVISNVTIENNIIATLTFSGSVKFHVNNDAEDNAPMVIIQKCINVRLVILSGQSLSFEELAKKIESIKLLKGKEIPLIQCWNTRITIQSNKIIEIIAGEVPSIK